VKIRVLEVLASLRRAGAERMAVSLACGLDSARFETEVVSLFDAFPDGFESVLAASSIPTHHLGKHAGLDLRMIPRLARVLRSFRPDIVHTHSYLLRYALPAHWAARGGTLVHTVHNLARQEVEWLGRMVHRVAFRCGVVPVAVAGEVARSFREVYGFAPAATIPNGIDLAAFQHPEARLAWRRAHGFSEQDGLIVSVARLEPQKNPLALIRAFTDALAGAPRWHLLLAGDGSLGEAVRALAAPRVHFLGVCDDVPALLAAADVFALASNWEGNPMSVMEAMAAGLPVVATSVGGVPELVEDILVPPGDTPALAASLASLAHDPARRRALAETSRRRAERFSLASMVGSYAALFERLVSGTR
jgi:glycosyltransferase involved in cell wall biosynthesis